MTRDEALRLALEQPQAWCPDVCPITGLPFFMWIEHPEQGLVPTYGGPLDSYTIPVRQNDGSYCRERYDHDMGGWLLDEVEDVGVRIVSDQEALEQPPQEPVGEVSWHDWSTGLLYKDLEPGAPLYTTPPRREWVGLTDDEVMDLAEFGKIGFITDLARAIEARLKERNA